MGDEVVHEERAVAASETPKTVKETPVSPEAAESQKAEKAPLTAEEFATALQQLVERAIASDLDPIRLMARAYGRQVVASIGQQGMATVNGILDRLVDGNLLKKS